MMFPMLRPLLRHVVLWSCLALVVGGCATVPAGGRDDDPFEPFNRAVYDLNSVLDRTLIEPTARVYRAMLPQFVRDRIRAFVDNLAEPRIFVNAILEGRGEAAGVTFARFFINTTAGFGGLFDQASDAGLTRQTGDFGQTLYVWGVRDAPYLVLPIFGPSNVRDAIGLGVDLYTTPPAHMFGGDNGPATEFAIGAIDGIDLRERNIETLAEIKKGALDEYAHFRSLFRQYRQAQLRAAAGEKPDLEELIDPEAPEQRP